MSLNIGVVQLTSVLDPEVNLEKIRSLLKEQDLSQVDAVFLPECFYSLSNGLKASPYLVEKTNQHYLAIQNLAKSHSVALLGGTVAHRLGDKVINRNYNFDSEGNELSYYDKIHLFSCQLKNKDEEKKIDEADIYTPGRGPQTLEFKNWKIGLGICFDLRFSQMAYNYRQQGCQMLTYSSAFTRPTGRAHWHTLLRARAIENQCYVVASAQWGKNNERISTFGHSLVVDPWGEVLLDLEEGEKIGFATCSLNRVDEVRKMVLMG